jgi:hypothetical protein
MDCFVLLRRRLAVLAMTQDNAPPALLFDRRGHAVRKKKVRGMMRRKTQGIPDTPRAVASARPPHGASHPHRLAPVADALLRRFPSGMGPRFASMRLDLRMASAGSRQGSLVTPGGAPMPPGSAADEAARAGAAPRSINRRHRLTPLMNEVEA